MAKTARSSWSGLLEHGFVDLVAERRATTERRVVKAHDGDGAHQGVGQEHVVGSEQVLDREASILDGKAPLRQEAPDLGSLALAKSVGTRRAPLRGLDARRWRRSARRSA